MHTPATRHHEISALLATCEHLAAAIPPPGISDARRRHALALESQFFRALTDAAGAPVDSPEQVAGYREARQLGRARCRLFAPTAS